VLPAETTRPTSTRLVTSSCCAATSFVTRDETYPLKVEYELTALGLSLVGVFAQLKKWADTNMDKVSTAHDDYDAQRDEITERAMSSSGDYQRP